MKAEIRCYEDHDWPALSAFIREYWSADHPVLHKPLFDWQYRGFGAAASQTLLLFDQDELVGFLGLIPGIYQLNQPDAATTSGCALAMWMVRPDLRQAGLGLLMLAHAEKQHKVIVCLGANQEAGRYYARRGYAECPRLSRWVAGLSQRYAELCAARPQTETLDAWMKMIERVTAADSIAPSASDMASLWQKRSHDGRRWILQGLFRNESFWQWRYLQSAGFDYQFFGDPADGPLIVARYEHVQDTDFKVLRMIEAIPRQQDAWLGAADDAMVTLVHAVLRTAADNGCDAADCQFAGEVLTETLAATTLRRQAWPLASDPCSSLAPVFQPLLTDKPPINAYWRVMSATASQTPWHFAKSDGDMDRPHAII